MLYNYILFRGQKSLQIEFSTSNFVPQKYGKAKKKSNFVLKS